MKNAYRFILVSWFALIGITPAHATTVSQADLDRGIQHFRSTQLKDGSWTGLIRSSTILYSAQTIFLYEYLNLAHEKNDRIQAMMNWIWTQQEPLGGFASYHGDEENVGISVEAYMAAKISGENENTPRMLKLEQAIERLGGLKNATLATPFLMIFGINSNASCVPGFLESLLVSADSRLPWLRVMIYPMLYLFSENKIHPLDPSKSPLRLGHDGGCPSGLPHPLRKFKFGHDAFFQWLDEHLNSDGTLFDYVPTSIFAAMAMSSEGARYTDRLQTFLKTVENFQYEVPNGLVQAAGEASIGETALIAQGFLDMGLPSDDPILTEAEKFLRSMQQEKTGAFGFSKHNVHFPSADDTSTAIHPLQMIVKQNHDPLLGAEMNRALDWTLTIQNGDGGFGSWEKDQHPWVTKLLGSSIKSKRYDMSVSTVEPTARIAQTLALFKDNLSAQASYRRAVNWLVSQQEKDGSFAGVWLVDYLVTTATVMRAIAPFEQDPKVENTVELGLQFMKDHQLVDGGFSESPESFEKKKSIPLAFSSPSQTGIVLTHLLGFLELENFKHWDLMKPSIERATEFLIKTQNQDGAWHDPTWTGVSFPGLEYLIFPYYQDLSPLQALGMYKRLIEEGHR